MKESVRQLLEIASKDRNFSEKLKKAATTDEIIQLAAEKNLILTEEDFREEKRELSDDEIEAVSGGNDCTCVAGGGGTSDDISDTCACVVYGIGEYNQQGYIQHGVNVRCSCCLIGAGNGYGHV